jgi:hypothetical protein
MEYSDSPSLRRFPAVLELPLRIVGNPGNHGNRGGDIGKIKENRLQDDFLGSSPTERRKKCDIDDKKSE